MNRAKNRTLLKTIIHNLLTMPKHLWEYVKGQTINLSQSAKMAEHAQPLTITDKTVTQIRKALRQQLSSPQATLQALTADERQLIQRIKQNTDMLNHNNVTRTQAYWHTYQNHPELHWSLLAHMVSRNGGWNMTDLQGELLPRLITPAKAEHIFSFLERANALIFQDAYPQLLLYSESIKRNRNLFHLLRQFHVSSFMLPLWNHFWQYRDPITLTVALIINEQHYIEGRIVQHPWYKENVLDTALFKTQAVLQLNQIVFPFADQEKPRLAGLIVENFARLEERIEIGKKLYSILFGVPEIFQGVVHFAATHSHTGSRADFWPGLFTSLRENPPSKTYQERLVGCKLNKGAEKLFSPKLEAAWPNQKMDIPERYDWFHDLSGTNHLRTISIPHAFEITNEYCFGLNKIELAVLAGEQLTD